ncbi:MvdC/MvdD family ATP grasp protein [Streptomyces barkulensis]|uniref:MvdC/MvdD family ATP grasp protein n=1 Tax=Streptomyces barkulensis TaxID=1257026 RepID=UPI001F0ED157|nr:ATP-grasp ribosomal peptide maturase [Streptomyces barkulensis]
MINDGPVLVVTMIDDPTADLVINELHDRGTPVVRLDSGDFPATLSVAATITEEGISGTLVTPTRAADLSRVRSLYYRRPSGFAFPHLNEQDARFAVTQARYGLGGVLASLPGCLYVNHPHRIGDAEFKPSGLVAAAQCGFKVPDTMVTSDPEAAKRFVKDHGPAVYKPLSTPLYRVDGASCTVEVGEVTADQLDGQVAGTAHLFQSRVDKVADVRVTVIGDRIFPVRIDSGLLDVDAGAWAALRRESERRLVRQGGPDRLWDRIEDHLSRWHRDGAPTLDRFLITASPEGQRITWTT